MHLKVSSFQNTTGLFLFTWSREGSRRQIAVFYFSPQSVWKAKRSTASVTWPTLWENATTMPAKTATTWAVPSVRPHPVMRTTSSETTSAKASAQTSRSGWASTTCWMRGPGWTRPAWALHTKTGTRPTAGPLNRMVARHRTAAACPGPPAGSGSTRTVVRRSPPSASSTSFDHIYCITDCAWLYSRCNAMLPAILKGVLSQWFSAGLESGLNSDLGVSLNIKLLFLNEWCHLQDSLWPQ